MKPNLYLPVIALALLLFTVWNVYGKQNHVVSPAIQAWEYKSIVIVRPAKSNNDWSDWAEVTGEQVKTLPLPVMVPKKAKELGEQGWELISATAVSNNAGGSGNAGYNDLAGFTSQIIYWFKRPK